MPRSTASSHKRPSRLRQWLLLCGLTLTVPILAEVVLQGAERGRPGARFQLARTAERLAPSPRTHTAPVLQVYAARTWGAKGAVSVHTWISMKRAGENAYRSYEIVGWRLRRLGTALMERTDQMPDRAWYGNPPTLLVDLRGGDVEALIDEVERAIAAYPYAKTYTLWPGPNSNTFLAYVGRAVPGLGLDLPATAIGKDWRPLADAVGRSPSGTGLQASLWGLASVTLGWEEGLELGLLGLHLEVDLFDLAVELPGLGRVGLPAAPFPLN